MEASRERRWDCERTEGSVDLVGRIGKLRWLGMQREAEELHISLRHVRGTDCVVVVPRESD